EYIGLPYVSAYLDTINADYRHGANFATSGSTIRSANSFISLGSTSPFYLQIQTTQYTQFKTRIIDLWSSRHPKADKSHIQEPADFSKALFTVDIGQNDLILGFFTLSKKKQRAAIPDIIDEFAISVKVQLFHDTVIVANKNPKPGYLDRFGCIKYQNNLAMEFNKKLKTRVIKLRSELTEAAITYVDIYTAKYKLISNTKEYGFNDPLKVCCEFHVDDVHIFCGNSVTVNGTTVLSDACTNPETYVSWDGIHMTEAANLWVANHVLNGSLSDPPIPVTHACYKQDGSTTMGRPNGTSRIVVTTFTGVMLGFFLGMSFPIVLLDKKTNMHSTVPTSIDLRDIQDKYPGISTQAALNVWSSMQHNKLIQSDNYRSTKIWAPDNPRGAETLPPGLIERESDLYLRRLWGTPSEDLSIKPKYLIAFTVGYDQKENIDKAMKKDEALGLDDFEAEKYIELMKKHGLAKEKEDGAQTHILPPCAAYCLQFMFISKKLDIVNVTLPFKLLDTSLLQEKIGVVDAHP
ncbi:GDSL esterase/lipase-like protein, partial [Tanacetum coccineum]